MSRIVTVRAEMEIEFERPEDASEFVKRDEPLRQCLHDALWNTARAGGWLRSGSRTKIAALWVNDLPGAPEQPDSEGATE
jgi:hypothetical protein